LAGGHGKPGDVGQKLAPTERAEHKTGAAQGLRWWGKVVEQSVETVRRTFQSCPNQITESVTGLKPFDVTFYVRLPKRGSLALKVRIDFYPPGSRRALLQQLKQFGCRIGPLSSKPLQNRTPV
jgi:hypothetical protein